MTTFLRSQPSTRGAITEALTERGYTLAGTFTDDGGGGATATYVAGGTVVCRLDTLSGNESEIANRISDRSTHLLTLPPNTAITIQNDFVIDGRGTFEVTAIREHTDELATLAEVVPR